MFTGWALLTSTTIGEAERPVLDLGPFNYTHHSLMLGVYSHLVLFAVAYLASFFFAADPPDRRLTLYGWLAQRRAAQSAVPALPEPVEEEVGALRSM